VANPIAIVGIGCHYPDAKSPDELFANVLAGRRAFRRIPDERLPLADYGPRDGSPNEDDVDRTYVTQAALIEGYEFDRLRFKIVGSTYRSADLTHWLALDVADRALADAGFAAGEGLPRERTGVVLGNTLTGEFSRSQMMRLRWPYVEKLLDEEMTTLLPEAADREAFIRHFEDRFKAPFEPFGDESLAGGLANTIAGRICNYFDLNGGGFTVDGACSSSLLATANACAALEAGDLDVALAGGVDLSLDPFELVGFARTGALARDEMRVYDRRAQGFWPGEGCGVLVLMREADAVAEGRRVYARVRGWGISSDGAGGISRPEQRGQLLALRRAYERAGFGAESVAYFEGHGTGTPVGDATELGALSQLLEESGVPTDRPTAIGSIKANIGHTKAASGVAGLIKAALAVYEQTIPPMPACERPHDLVGGAEGARLRVESRARHWPADRPLRAAVSSMGFGGINAHVVLDGGDRARTGGVARPLSARSVGAAQSELFLLVAESIEALRVQVAKLLENAGRLSRAELGDLAAALAETAESASATHTISDDRDGASSGAGRAACRAAIVARDPADLDLRLRILDTWLDDFESTPDAPHRIDIERGVFLARGDAPVRIGLLFPGQGAPIPANLDSIEALCSAPESRAARDLYGEVTLAVHARPEGEVVDTAVAQPAIAAASIAGAEVLAELGVVASLALGHSVGEIAALQWGGALDAKEAVHLCETRGRIMSELARPGGAMANVSAERERVESLLVGEPCCIAAHNGPARCVVSGDADAVERVIESAREQRIAAVKLPVSHAFHSPHVAPCGESLATALGNVHFAPLRRTIISTRSGEPLGRAPESLAQHLVAQLTEPVVFAMAATEAARDVDLFIEVGPGRMLGGMLGEFIDTPVVSLEVGNDRSRGLLLALGAAHALGAPVGATRLFHDRLTKPFDIERRLRFFANPCSPQPADAAGDNVAAQPTPDSEAVDPTTERDRSVLEILTELVAARCELPASALCESDRFLSDLHLTSIAVSELAAEAARLCERHPLVAPAEFADAALGELASAIEADDRITSRTSVTLGVDAWVRAFEIVGLPRPRPRSARAVEGVPDESQWRAFTPSDDNLGTAIVNALRAEAGRDGVFVHLPPLPEARRDENLKRLLAAAKAAHDGLESRAFVLVHHGDPGVAIARTLHLEAHSLTTRVIEAPASLAADKAADKAPSEASVREFANAVVGEVRAAASYAEASYDEGGVRSERRLRLLPVSSDRAPLPIGADDVLLVTGGGKGIAAECALGLARETGCRLGIIGRSSPDEDDELKKNLERFEAAGVRHRYAAANVVDNAAVARAIEVIEAECGRVTGLIHGAGVNKPGALAALGEDAFAATIGPKVDGLDNVLRCLDQERLRCLVGFGSIIAELGLPGEAHYALANEMLTRRIEAYAAKHPETRCLCLEWSIWSGVGMGERLGRVETLAAQNISAITPEEGMGWLLDLLADRDAPVRLFLSGRFGAPPTLSVEESELPLARFCERVREHTPGVELVVDAELSFEADPYLADHIYAGEAILPGVMGLEAMAQVVGALRGELAGELRSPNVEPGTPRFEKVAFHRAVVVPREGKRTLRVAALVRRDGVVDVVLRSDATDFQLDHMRAELHFDPAPMRDGPCPHSETSVLETKVLEANAPPAAAPLLDPARELYGDLFFHSGRFERIRGYHALRSDGCHAEIACRDEAFFGAFQPQRLWLGDAGARDAALHAIQACVPHRDLLPVGVERIETHVLGGQESVELRAHERAREGGLYTYDIEIASAAGEVLERWWGLQLQEVGGAAQRKSWPAGLLAPRIEEMAGACHPGLGLGLSAAVVPGSDAEASQRAVDISKGAPAPLCRRPDGKPLFEASAHADAPEHHVSTSHANGHTLAVVSPHRVACDMEVIEARSPELWQDLLGRDRFKLAKAISRERSECIDTSATRLWGAIECLRKFGLQRETPLSVAGDCAGEVVRIEAGAYATVSLEATVRGAGHPVVISLLARSSKRDRADAEL